MSRGTTFNACVPLCGTRPSVRRLGWGTRVSRRVFSCTPSGVHGRILVTCRGMRHDCSGLPVGDRFAGLVGSCPRDLGALTTRR